MAVTSVLLVLGVQSPSLCSMSLPPSHPSYLPAPNRRGWQRRVHLFPVSQTALTHFQQALLSEIESQAMLFTSVCAPKPIWLLCIVLPAEREAKYQSNSFPIIWRSLHRPLFLLLLLKVNAYLRYPDIFIRNNQNRQKTASNVQS